MQNRLVDYRDGDAVVEGRIVSRARAGRSDSEVGRADGLARPGYAGLSPGLCGEGVRGGNPEKNVALMQPVRDDRAMLQQRSLVSLETLRNHPEVDADRLAANDPEMGTVYDATADRRSSQAIAKFLAELF